MRRRPSPSWQDGTPTWPSRAGTHRGLPWHSEELTWIHIIAGAREETQTVEEFTRCGRNAGATSTLFDSVPAMILALRERTFWRVVLLVDKSILRSREDITKLSEARGERQSSVPLFVTRDSTGEKLPGNTHRLAGTPEAIANFNWKVLDLLVKKK